MAGTQHLWGFLLACVALSAIPGPATLYILGRTVAQGRQAGILSLLGTSMGSIVHVAFAAAGLSAVLAASAFAFATVKVVGAAYLIGLGLVTLLNRGEIAVDAAPAAVRLPFRQGLLTQVLNPKVAVFMMTFLPQFVAPTAKGPLPFLCLGMTFVTLDTLWFLVLVLAADRMARRVRANERIVSRLRRLVGLVYVGLGLNLLRAQRQVG